MLESLIAANLPPPASLGPVVAIIALSAHAMPAERKRCEEAGCSAYITKPVNHDQLIRAVAAVYANFQTQQEMTTLLG